MAEQKKRVKYTVSQAKNLMRRSLNEILDPGPSNVDELWSHFDSACAYCRTPLDRSLRHGHVDHATTGGGNQLGNLILACSRCNGDEKLDQDWPAFLLLKTSGDGNSLAERTERIESCFAKHPIRPITLSSDALQLRDEIEALIGQFHEKCNELKAAVRRPDKTPIDDTVAPLAGQ
jgi:5-methylcytosine-specific restriction endonuclease McrA